MVGKLGWVVVGQVGSGVLVVATGVDVLAVVAPVVGAVVGVHGSIVIRLSSRGHKLHS